MFLSLHLRFGLRLSFRCGEGAADRIARRCGTGASGGPSVGTQLGSEGTAGSLRVCGLLALC